MPPVRRPEGLQSLGAGLRPQGRPRSGLAELEQDARGTRHLAGQGRVEKADVSAAVAPASPLGRGDVQDGDAARRRVILETGDRGRGVGRPRRDGRSRPGPRAPGLRSEPSGAPARSLDLAQPLQPLDVVNDPGDQDGRRRPGRGPDRARHGRGRSRRPSPRAREAIEPSGATGPGRGAVQAGVAHRPSGLGRGRGVGLREAGSVLAHRCRRRRRWLAGATCARTWTLRSAGDPSSENRPKTGAWPFLLLKWNLLRSRQKRISSVYPMSTWIRGGTVQFLGQRPPPAL